MAWLNDPNILALLYAFAGLMGGVVHVLASRKPFLGPDGITVIATGAIIGGAWLVWPPFDFGPTVPVVARMFAIFAIALLLGEAVRRYIVKKLLARFGLDPSADTDPPPPGGPGGPTVKLLVLALVCLIALTGCASGGFNLVGEDRIQSPLERLMGLAKKDAGAAIARTERYLLTPAGKADQGAPFRLRCYRTLHAHLTDEAKVAAPVAPIAGLIDGFELAAEVVNAGAGGGLLKIPEAVKADCRYVEDEIKRYVLSRGLKFAPVPGAAAVGDFIGR